MSKKEAPSAKKKKAVNAQRLTIGILIFFGILGSVTFLSGDPEVDTSDSAAKLIPPASITRNGRLNISVRDKRVTELADADHQQEIDNARKATRSAVVLAPLPTSFKPIVKEVNKPIDTRSGIKKLSAGQIAGGGSEAQAPVAQKENIRKAQILAEMGRFSNILRPSGPTVVLVDGKSGGNNLDGGQNTALAFNPINPVDPVSIATSPEDDTGTQYDGHKFNAGDIAYAVTDIGLMSDEPGPIRLTVLSGPAKGAILVGSYTLPDPRSEAVTMQINTVQFAGETFSISAFVLNADTYRPGLASSVDTHFFLRWGSFVSAAVVASIGQVIREQNTATTNTIGSGTGTNPTVTNTPTFSPSQRGWVVAADVADKISPIVEQNFNTPNTVIVNPNEPVVIMFMDAVVFPKKESRGN